MAAGKQVAIIGAALDLGAGRRGVDMGPSAIRYAGLHERLSGIGYDVVDWGDVETALQEASEEDDPSARYLPEIKAACGRIARLVGLAVEQDALPLVLGGDHSVALGTLGGLAQASGLGGVLWIDAHGDLNTPETSPTGNVHGMPLAAVIGLTNGRFESDAWTLPAVDPERVALVGLRELDRQERGRIRELGIRAYTMSDIDRIGIERAVRESLDARGRAELRAPLARHGRARPGVRARGRHPGARRALLPRGAPRARARGGVGDRRLDRGRRGEPDSRPRRTRRRRSRSSSSRARSARRSSRTRW